MGSEQGLTTLGDFTNLLTGHPFKSQLFTDQGIKLLRGDNISQGSLRWENAKFFPTSALDEKIKKYLLLEGDVILAMDRPWIEAGLKFSEITTSDLPCLLVQRVACLRAKDPLDQEFLKCIISSPEFSQYVLRVQTGTAVPHISGSQIQEYEFRLLPTQARIKIGNFISFLDRKIRLNTQTNQTLEEMAQAIFKSWFVDFDPVKAKAQIIAQGGSEQDANLAAMEVISGKTRDQLAALEKTHPEHYSQLHTTATLFPSAFVDSELGEIPEGWECTSLAEAIELIGGGTPKRSQENYWGGDIPWFSIKDIPNEGEIYVLRTSETITEIGLQKSSTKIIPEGATIITARGTVGKLALVGRDMAMNQSCYGVLPKKELGSLFNYFNLKNSIEILKKNTHGAVFDTITQSTFETVDCIIPQESICRSFENIVSPLLQRIKSNLIESYSLKKTRDSLLPKLLSGEIDVSQLNLEA